MSSLTTTIKPTDPSVFPQFYSFPPFYTRQPNENTWASQLSIWRQFVIDYCRFHRIWRLHLTDAIETELFANKSINRKLNLDAAKEVIDSLVSSGNAEWTSAEKIAASIYWRKPEEWADMIAGWIDETGQKNTVFTLYEIGEGDLTEGQEFHGIDQAVLQKALGVLTKRGTASVFHQGEDYGVKFF